MKDILAEELLQHENELIRLRRSFHRCPETAWEEVRTTKMIRDYLTPLGFTLKELIIKEQHNCKATGYWKTNSVKYNFLLIAHEYLFVFRKQKK